MEIINLTPHVINALSRDGTSVVGTFPPSGQVARLAMNRHQQGLVQGIPLYVNTVGEVEGLPSQQEGVYLLVSALVRTAFPERKDLLSPGELVRDASGQPIGCKGFDRN